MASEALIGLDDGIQLQIGEEWLKIAVPKTTKPKRERALKLADAKNGVYEVPKSDVYNRAQTKLADGSTLVVMRYKQIPHEEREKMFAKGVAEGMKLKPLEKQRKAEGEYESRVTLKWDDLK